MPDFLFGLQARSSLFPVKRVLSFLRHTSRWLCRFMWMSEITSAGKHVLQTHMICLSDTQTPCQDLNHMKMMQGSTQPSQFRLCKSRLQRNRTPSEGHYSACRDYHLDPSQLFKRLVHPPSLLARWKEYAVTPTAFGPRRSKLKMEEINGHLVPLSS